MLHTLRMASDLDLRVSQAQVGDIGLMGGPAKLDGKAVEGVRIMVRSATLTQPKFKPKLKTAHEVGTPP